MDNLTHSLIGLIAGEAFGHVGRRRSENNLQETQRRAGLFVTLSVIGNNLPDLDLLYSYRPLAHDRRAAQLDYMLQHRGYTHTLVGCLILALLLYGVVELWAWWTRRPLTLRDRLAFFGVSLSGTSLHLVMDYFNSYGVHPFWPLWDGWLYGDSVFIVEPLYWAAAVPLFFVVRPKWARGVIVLAPLIAAILASASHMAGAAWSVGYIVLAAVMLFIGSRVTARNGALVSACAAVLVTMMFGVAGRVAAGKIEDIVGVEFPREGQVDHILTPSPMNPLSWDVLVLGIEGDRYIARQGKLELAGQIQWLHEFYMPRAELVKLVATHCDVAAFSQFARAPFLKDRTIVDLRFEREGGSGMGSFVPGPADKAPCHRTVPWIPPRADLLDPGR